jgi:hypothetical protein
VAPALVPVPVQARALAQRVELALRAELAVLARAARSLGLAAAQAALRQAPRISSR